MSHVPPGRGDAPNSPARATASSPATASANSSQRAPVTDPLTVAGQQLLTGTLTQPVIAVDAMGGDYAPDEIVAGALAAQREHGVTTLLAGPPARRAAW